MVDLTKIPGWENGFDLIQRTADLAKSNPLYGLEMLENLKKKLDAQNKEDATSKYFIECIDTFLSTAHDFDSPQEVQRQFARAFNIVYPQKKRELDFDIKMKVGWYIHAIIKKQEKLDGRCSQARACEILMQYRDKIYESEVRAYVRALNQTTSLKQAYRDYLKHQEELAEWM